MYLKQKPVYAKLQNLLAPFSLTSFACTLFDFHGFLYHSPHKFRHGHIQYAMSLAKSITDYKAVSMNVMHSSMEITDEFYSNLNDGEIQNRICSLGKQTNFEDYDDLTMIKEFLEWKRRSQK